MNALGSGSGREARVSKGNHVNVTLTKLAFASLVWAVGISPCLAEKARYRSTFDVVWSADTHPIQTPATPHFSGPIGATHNNDVVFWETGKLASQGIQDMAERGSRTVLTEEVQTAISAGTADAVVAFCCTLDSPGSEKLEFSVDDAFPLISLVTMIAPSPDWFVGVSSLSLRDDDGWIGKTVIDLLPFDAGTDSGVTFVSANQPTEPHVPIGQITTNPFPDAVPLGTLTFLRILHGDLTDNGVLDVSDLDRLSLAIRDRETVTTFDMDGDGTVSDTDRLYWIHELKRSYLGDANLDGRFTSDDFVEVIAVGEYEDATRGNSGWADGDWDGDGDFTSSDLIVALADGGYEQGPQSAASAIPEPTSIRPWRWSA